MAGAVSTRENEDIFLHDVRGRDYVGVKKSRKGRVPRPIFVGAARGKAWAKRKA
jgi:hypothetical protein